MYSTVNSIACINGVKGIYDGVIQNPSVRYGRNAINNYNEYMGEFVKPIPKLPDMKGIADLSADEFSKRTDEFTKALQEPDNCPPANFELRYQDESTPVGKVDYMALLGSAYEEMGKNFSLGVKGFTEKLQKAFGANISAEALDLNKDSEIDIAEYAVSTLAADMLSTDSSQLADENITGVITNQGQNAALALINKQNYNIASQIFNGIYQNHHLDEAQQEFKKNINNII